MITYTLYVFCGYLRLHTRNKRLKGAKHFVVYFCIWSVYFSSSFDKVYFFMFLMKLSSLLHFKNMRGSKVLFKWVKDYHKTLCVMKKILFSQNLDLMVHKLYERPNERYSSDEPLVYIVFYFHRLCQRCNMRQYTVNNLNDGFYAN
jgi:hypothetical protein